VPLQTPITPAHRLSLNPAGPPAACALASATAGRDPSALRGSRRRRLWELEGPAHCPVVGVCLPIAALRRLIDKALGGQAVADDYELHCGVVTECKLRTPIAEALQRELDRRYALPLRQSAKAKSTEALAAWWGDEMRSHDVAGALWATLTHARCSVDLTNRVLGEVHMLQHQAGMAARVDLDRFEALIEENGVLARELAGAQQRSSRHAQEHARLSDDQQLQIMRLRGQLMTRDTTIAHLREDLRSLESAVAGLKDPIELARENRRQAERIQTLERAALPLQQEADRQRRRAEALAAALQRRDALVAVARHSTPLGTAAANAPARLDAQAVLCVGGRTAAVPLYRHIVEKVGGRFLHHDGGDEDSSARLDATLAAADLVICQTGCISHNAYWRVKDHCKRTGKRCVFVETPSTAGIKRALLTLAPAAALTALPADEKEPAR
jgi:Uncharacterized protein conserved in bacteria (DUF2325)